MENERCAHGVQPWPQGLVSIEAIFGTELLRFRLERLRQIRRAMQLSAAQNYRPEAT